jgi:hypothetical protein
MKCHRHKIDTVDRRGRTMILSSTEAGLEFSPMGFQEVCAPCPS